MKKFKLSKFFIVVVLLVLFSASLIFLPYIEAFVLNPGPPTINDATVAVPTTTLTYRDSTNTDNSTVTITTSPDTLTVGTTVTITVIDKDANFDLGKQDSIFVSVNSTTSFQNTPSEEIVVTLQESAVNSGTFTGTMVLSGTTTGGNTVQVSAGDDLTVFYIAFPFTYDILS